MIITVLLALHLPIRSLGSKEALQTTTHLSPKNVLPLPTQRQLDFMEMEKTQFVHFGLPTFWKPPPSFLHTPNPTYHNCFTTSMDHSSQTSGGYYPCLNPNLFKPTNLNTDQWMEAATAMGMNELCLTSHHEGGFALWPSNYTDYSVKASKLWKGGKGDVLREFVNSAKKFTRNICYYINVQTDGYGVLVQNITMNDFITRQVGMVRELITQYGPVNRLWFDSTNTKFFTPHQYDTLWGQIYRTIRTLSPHTIISPYRGDVCTYPSSLYNRDFPAPNTTTDLSFCGLRNSNARPLESGKYFLPNEMHGLTMQEGYDANTDDKPTYWFWHDWACAGNVSGCPWVGYGNSSRIFEGFLKTVGRGAVLNLNIPPDGTGRINGSVVEVMEEVGKGWNDTFGDGMDVSSLDGLVWGGCGETVSSSKFVIDDIRGRSFDYVVIMEDLRYGQRIANYSIEYRTNNNTQWEVLVPVVLHNPNITTSTRVYDRPDGHDARDSYIGHKRIDIPNVKTSGPSRIPVIQSVRFVCHRSMSDPIYLRYFAVHRKRVPWEEFLEDYEQEPYSDPTAIS